MPQECPALRLIVCGAVNLYSADNQCLPLTTRARALLAMAALEPEHSVSRERCAGIIWPGRWKDQARASLRQCLAEVRKVAGNDVLEGDYNSFRLNSKTISIDIDEIETIPNVARIIAAIDMSPRAVSGLELLGPFVSWQTEAAKSVQRRIERIVRHQLDACRDRSDWREMRQLADSWLEHYPNDPHAVAAAMLADTELGQIASARKRFNDRADIELLPSVGNPDPLGRPIIGVRISAPESARELAGDVRDDTMDTLGRFREYCLKEIGPASPPAGCSYMLDIAVKGPSRGLLAQLFQVDGGAMIWSARIQPESQTDVDQLLPLLRQQLESELLPAIDRDLELCTADISGPHYARYLHAKSLLGLHCTHETGLKAAELLEAIIAENPNFSLAYLPLARLYNTDFDYTRARSTGQRERARAQELARRAAELDPINAHAFILLGWCALWRRSWAEAMDCFSRAVIRNPHNAAHLNAAGNGMLYLGEIARAKELILRSRSAYGRADPVYWNDWGLLHLVTGDFEVARDALPHGQGGLVWCVLYRLTANALSGHPTDDIAAEARRHLTVVWDGRMPATGELLDWIGYHHPFRLNSMLNVLLEGVRLGLSE